MRVVVIVVIVVIVIGHCLGVSAVGWGTVFVVVVVVEKENERKKVLEERGERRRGGGARTTRNCQCLASCWGTMPSCWCVDSTPGYNILAGVGRIWGKDLGRWWGGEGQHPAFH